MIRATSVRFQSTPPARGATKGLKMEIKMNRISIHAPREGGDMAENNDALMAYDFNPRPPRGGRLIVIIF